MEILTDAWLLFTFQKKVLQFLCNFGNSISSCCARLLPLAIFHSTFLQHMQFQKYQSYSHLFAFTLAGKWVWISRIHQLCSYTMRKHFIVTRFKLDFKLSQVCILPLKQRLRNQFVQYLDMVVIYWAERYTYFFNRLVAFFIAKCFTY